MAIHGRSPGPTESFRLGQSGFIVYIHDLHVSHVAGSKRKHESSRSKRRKKPRNEPSLGSSMPAHDAEHRDLFCSYHACMHAAYAAFMHDMGCFAYEHIMQFYHACMYRYRFGDSTPI